MHLWVISIADKTRNTFPISVDFFEGELPSSAKLNGLAKQSKQGLSLVEYALGDLWNQSGDSFLTGLLDARLMIPNIARYIGAIKYLNPRVPNLPYIEEYSYTLTATSHEFQLPFPVHSTSTFVWETQPSLNTTPETSIEDVTGPGQWYLNYKTGYVHSYTAVSANINLVYKPGYFDDEGVEQEGIRGDIGVDAGFNIIPDAFADPAYNFRGVKIEKLAEADSYKIYLPPRTPLVDSRMLSIMPPKNNGYNTEQGQADDPHVRKFYQTTASPTLAATTEPEAQHYRYNLPKVLTESASWQSGARLPDGFLYLYDEYGTGTILEGISFFAETAPSPRTWVVVAKGANLTTWLSSTQGASQYSTAALELSDTHPTFHGYLLYPNNGLKLITVGSDISQAVSELVKTLVDREYNGSDPTFKKLISHKDLIETFDPGGDYTASNLVNDDHPQYLHRDGYTVQRPASNMMLGPLVLSDINGGEGTLSNSHELVFGNVFFGPRINWDANNSALKVTSGVGSNKNIILDISGFGSSIRSFANADSYLDIFAQGIQLGTGDYSGVNNSEPVYINFRTQENETHPENVQLGATTGGDIFLRAGDKTGLGEGGLLYCNRYKVGQYEDSLLGYSGHPEYGPVRYLNVSPIDFKYFETSSSWTSGTSRARAYPNGFNKIGYYGYGNSSTDQIISIIGEVGYAASGDQGSNVKQHALYYINLPWSDYMIVDVRMSIEFNDSITSRNAFVFGMGSQPTLNYFNYNVEEEVNASSILSLSSTSIQGPFYVFGNANTSGDYIMRVQQSGPAGNDAKVPVFYMRSPSVNTAGGGMRFAGVQILYRVREI